MNFRRSPIARFICAVLVVTFLSSDIAWAHPDRLNISAVESCKISQSTKLAASTSFCDSEFTGEAQLKFLKAYIAGSGIPSQELTPGIIGSLLIGGCDDEPWFRQMSYSAGENEVLVRIASCVVRYFNPYRSGEFKYSDNPNLRPSSVVINDNPGKRQGLREQLLEGADAESAIKAIEVLRSRPKIAPRISFAKILNDANVEKIGIAMRRIYRAAAHFIFWIHTIISPRISRISRAASDILSRRNISLIILTGTIALCFYVAGHHDAGFIYPFIIMLECDRIAIRRALQEQARLELEEADRRDRAEKIIEEIERVVEDIGSRLDGFSDAVSGEKDDLETEITDEETHDMREVAIETLIANFRLKTKKKSFEDLLPEIAAAIQARPLSRDKVERVMQVLNKDPVKKALMVVYDRAAEEIRPLPEGKKADALTADTDNGASSASSALLTKTTEALSALTNVLASNQSIVILCIAGYYLIKTFVFGAPLAHYDMFGLVLAQLAPQPPAAGGEMTAEEAAAFIGLYTNDLDKMANDGAINDTYYISKYAADLNSSVVNRGREHVILSGDADMCQGLIDAVVVRKQAFDNLRTAKFIEIDAQWFAESLAVPGELEQVIKKLTQAIKVLYKGEKVALVIDFQDFAYFKQMKAGMTTSLSFQLTDLIHESDIAKDPDVSVIILASPDLKETVLDKDAGLERTFNRITLKPDLLKLADIALRHVDKLGTIYRDVLPEGVEVTVAEKDVEKALELAQKYYTDGFPVNKFQEIIDKIITRACTREEIFRAGMYDLGGRIFKASSELAVSAAKGVASEETEFLETTLDRLLIDYDKAAAELAAHRAKFEKMRVDKAWRITLDEIAGQISVERNIPKYEIMATEDELLTRYEEEIGAMLIGQDKIIRDTYMAFRRRKGLGADANKPICITMGVGPTGVGKTEFARALAKHMFGDENAMIRLDMSEYASSADAQKLIGAPPSFIGYDNGGQLTKHVAKRPYSVVLLDEFEKAHEKVRNQFLPVFDDGVLRDSKGKLVSFRNTIIIMTSNIGFGEMQNEDEEKAYVGDSLARDFKAESAALEAAADTVLKEKLGWLKVQIDALRADLSKKGISDGALDEQSKKIAELLDIENIFVEGKAARAAFLAADLEATRRTCADYYNARTISVIYGILAAFKDPFNEADPEIVARARESVDIELALIGEFLRRRLIATDAAKSRDRERLLMQYLPIAAAAMTSDLDLRRRAIVGYLKAEVDERLNDKIDKEFPPEFIRRIGRGNIISFDPLSRGDLSKILDIKLRLVTSLLKEEGFGELTIAPEVRKLIITQGYDVTNGARPLERAMRRIILAPLSEKILAGAIDKGKRINASIESGAVVFTAEEVVADARELAHRETIGRLAQGVDLSAPELLEKIVGAAGVEKVPLLTKMDPDEARKLFEIDIPMPELPTLDLSTGALDQKITEYESAIARLEAEVNDLNSRLRSAPAPAQAAIGEQLFERKAKIVEHKRDKQMLEKQRAGDKAGAQADYEVCLKESSDEYARIRKQLNASFENLTVRACEGSLADLHPPFDALGNLAVVFKQKRRNYAAILSDSLFAQQMVVDSFAERAATGELSDFQKTRVLRLKLGTLVKHFSFVGKLEAELRKMVRAIEEDDIKKGIRTIIVIDFDVIKDEVERIRINPFLLAYFLRMFRSHKTIQFVVTTSRQTITDDDAYRMFFTKVEVSGQKASQVLENLYLYIREYIEKKYNHVKDDTITISFGAMRMAVRLWERYFSSKTATDVLNTWFGSLVNEKRQCELSYTTELRDRLSDLTARLGVIARSGATDSAALTRDNRVARFVREINDLHAHLKARSSPEISADEILTYIADEESKSGVGGADKILIETDAFRADERENILNLEKRLGERVIEQDEAVKAVTAAVKIAKAGLKPRKSPIGTFIFAGPTGVGKTQLAQTLAQALGYEYTERINMTEYANPSSVTKLLGAPPGFVGYGDDQRPEEGFLFDLMKKNPKRVLIFDEVEKGNPVIMNTLLQVLEDGRLTSNRGNTINFSDTVIIFTTNLGVKEVVDMPDGRKVVKYNLYPTLQEAILSGDPAKIASFKAKMSESVEAALKGFFRPEFLNRIEAKIVFNPLPVGSMSHIAEIVLREKVGRLLEGQYGAFLKVGRTAEEKEAILASVARLGIQSDSEGGARPVEHAIVDDADGVKSRLIKFMENDRPLEGDTIVITFDNGQVGFERIKAEEAKRQLPEEDEAVIAAIAERFKERPDEAIGREDLEEIFGFREEVPVGAGENVDMPNDADATVVTMAADFLARDPVVTDAIKKVTSLLPEKVLDPQSVEDPDALAAKIRDLAGSLLTEMVRVAKLANVEKYLYQTRRDTIRDYYGLAKKELAAAVEPYLTDMAGKAVEMRWFYDGQELKLAVTYDAGLTKYLSRELFAKTYESIEDIRKRAPRTLQGILKARAEVLTLGGKAGFFQEEDRTMLWFSIPTKPFQEAANARGLAARLRQLLVKKGPAVVAPPDEAVENTIDGAGNTVLPQTAPAALPPEPVQGQGAVKDGKRDVLIEGIKETLKSVALDIDNAFLHVTVNTPARIGGVTALSNIPLGLWKGDFSILHQKFIYGKESSLRPAVMFEVAPMTGDWDIRIGDWFMHYKTDSKSISSANNALSMVCTRDPIVDMQWLDDGRWTIVLDDKVAEFIREGVASSGTISCADGKSTLNWRIVSASEWAVEKNESPALLSRVKDLVVEIKKVERAASSSGIKTTISDGWTVGALFTESQLLQLAAIDPVAISIVVDFSNTPSFTVSACSRFGEQLTLCATEYGITDSLVDADSAPPGEMGGSVAGQNSVITNGDEDSNSDKMPDPMTMLDSAAEAVKENGAEAAGRARALIWRAYALLSGDKSSKNHTDALKELVQEKPVTFDVEKMIADFTKVVDEKTGETFEEGGKAIEVGTAAALLAEALAYSGNFDGAWFTIDQLKPILEKCNNKDSLELKARIASAKAVLVIRKWLAENPQPLDKGPDGTNDVICAKFIQDFNFSRQAGEEVRIDMAKKVLPLSDNNLFVLTDNNALCCDIETGIVSQYSGIIDAWAIPDTNSILTQDDDGKMFIKRMDPQEPGIIMSSGPLMNEGVKTGKYGVEFADGRIVTLDSDGTVRTWHVVSGAQISFDGSMFDKKTVKNVKKFVAIASNSFIALTKDERIECVFDGVDRESLSDIAVIESIGPGLAVISHKNGLVRLIDINSPAREKIVNAPDGIMHGVRGIVPCANGDFITRDSDDNMRRYRKAEGYKPVVLPEIFRKSSSGAVSNWGIIPLPYGNVVTMGEGFSARILDENFNEIGKLGEKGEEPDVFTYSKPCPLTGLENMYLVAFPPNQGKNIRIYNAKGEFVTELQDPKPGVIATADIIFPVSPDTFATMNACGLSVWRVEESMVSGAGIASSTKPKGGPNDVTKPQPFRPVGRRNSQPLVEESAFMREEKERSAKAYKTVRDAYNDARTDMLKSFDKGEWGVFKNAVGAFCSSCNDALKGLRLSGFKDVLSTIAVDLQCSLNELDGAGKDTASIAEDAGKIILMLAEFFERFDALADRGLLHETREGQYGSDQFEPSFVLGKYDSKVFAKMDVERANALVESLAIPADVHLDKAVPGLSLLYVDPKIYALLCRFYAMQGKEGQARFFLYLALLGKKDTPEWQAAYGPSIAAALTALGDVDSARQEIDRSIKSARALPPSLADVAKECILNSALARAEAGEQLPASMLEELEGYTFSSLTVRMRQGSIMAQIYSILGQNGNAERHLQFLKFAEREYLLGEKGVSILCVLCAEALSAHIDVEMRTYYLEKASQIADLLSEDEKIDAYSAIAHAEALIAVRYEEMRERAADDVFTVFYSRCKEVIRNHRQLVSSKFQIDALLTYNVSEFYNTLDGMPKAESVIGYGEQGSAIYNELLSLVGGLVDAIASIRKDGLMQDDEKKRLIIAALDRFERRLDGCRKLVSAKRFLLLPEAIVGGEEWIVPELVLKSQPVIAGSGTDLSAEALAKAEGDATKQSLRGIDPALETRKVPGSEPGEMDALEKMKEAPVEIILLKDEWRDPGDGTKTLDVDKRVNVTFGDIIGDAGGISLIASTPEKMAAIRRVEVIIEPPMKDSGSTDYKVEVDVFTPYSPQGVNTLRMGLLSRDKTIMSGLCSVDRLLDIIARYARYDKLVELIRAKLQQGEVINKCFVYKNPGSGNIRIIVEITPIMSGSNPETIRRAGFEFINDDIVSMPEDSGYNDYFPKNASMGAMQRSVPNEFREMIAQKFGIVEKDIYFTRYGMGSRTIFIAIGESGIKEYEYKDGVYAEVAADENMFAKLAAEYGISKPRDIHFIEMDGKELALITGDGVAAFVREGQGAGGKGQENTNDASGDKVPLKVSLKSTFKYSVDGINIGEKGRWILPNGDYLTWDSDGKVNIWDGKTPEVMTPRRTLAELKEILPGNPDRVQVDPVKGFIVIMDDKRIVNLYNRNGAFLNKLSNDNLGEASYTIINCFDDKTIIYVVHRGGFISGWDGRGFLFKDAYVNTLEFQPVRMTNGACAYIELISGSKVFKLSTSFTGSNKATYSVTGALSFKVSPDKKSVAVIKEDGTMDYIDMDGKVIFTAGDAKAIAEGRAPKIGTKACEVSDAGYVVTHDSDNHISIWRSESGVVTQQVLKSTGEAMFEPILPVKIVPLSNGCIFVNENNITEIAVFEEDGRGRGSSVYAPQWIRVGIVQIIPLGPDSAVIYDGNVSTEIFRNYKWTQICLDEADIDGKLSPVKGISVAGDTVMISHSNGVMRVWKVEYMTNDGLRIPIPASQPPQGPDADDDKALAALKAAPVADQPDAGSGLSGTSGFRLLETIVPVGALALIAAFVAWPGFVLSAIILSAGIWAMIGYAPKAVVNEGGEDTGLQSKNFDGEKCLRNAFEDSPLTKRASIAFSSSGDKGEYYADIDLHGSRGRLTLTIVGSVYSASFKFAHEHRFRVRRFAVSRQSLAGLLAKAVGAIENLFDLNGGESRDSTSSSRLKSAAPEERPAGDVVFATSGDRIRKLLAGSMDYIESGHAQDSLLSGHARIALSDEIFDGGVPDNLRILLQNNDRVMVRPLEQLLGLARASSHEELTIVTTKDAFEDLKKDAGKVRSGLLLLESKLSGDNYLYLEQVLKLACAMAAGNAEAVKSIYHLISGKHISDAALQNMGGDALAFALNAILTFDEIRIKDHARRDEYKRAMETFLYAA